MNSKKSDILIKVYEYEVLHKVGVQFKLQLLSVLQQHNEYLLERGSKVPDVKEYYNRSTVYITCQFIYQISITWTTSKEGANRTNCSNRDRKGIEINLTQINLSLSNFVPSNEEIETFSSTFSACFKEFKALN